MKLEMNFGVNCCVSWSRGREMEEEEEGGEIRFDDIVRWRCCLQLPFMVDLIPDSAFRIPHSAFRFSWPRSSSSSAPMAAHLSSTGAVISTNKIIHSNPPTSAFNLFISVYICLYLFQAVSSCLSYKIATKSFIQSLLLQVSSCL